MFPNAHDRPTQSSQAKTGLPVPTPVRLELLSPPCYVRLGFRPVPRTRMPEAPVYEHGHLRSAEHDVWPGPWYSDNRHIDRESRTQASQRRPQRQFRFGPGAPGSPHSDTSRCCWRAQASGKSMVHALNTIACKARAVKQPETARQGLTIAPAPHTVAANPTRI